MRLTVVRVIHTHTNTHTHTHARTHARAHAHTHTRARTHSLYKSAVLVEVHSEEVSNFLQSFLYNVSDGQHAVWIGLNDIFYEGSFVWSGSRTPPSFTAWAPGEPSNMDTLENCAAIRNEDFKTWSDLSCTLDMLFICQIR